MEIHRRIARRLESDSASVLGKARENLARWLASRPDDPLALVYREWQSLLAAMDSVELAAFLVSEDETAVRLRQSSPFAGVLPPREIWEIKRRHRHAAA